MHCIKWVHINIIRRRIPAAETGGKAMRPENIKRDNYAEEPQQYVTPELETLEVAPCDIIICSGSGDQQIDGNI